jgi:hypothetical protein
LGFPHSAPPPLLCQPLVQQQHICERVRPASVDSWGFMRMEWVKDLGPWFHINIKLLCWILIPPSHMEYFFAIWWTVIGVLMDPSMAGLSRQTSNSRVMKFELQPNFGMFELASLSSGITRTGLWFHFQ